MKSAFASIRQRVTRMLALLSSLIHSNEFSSCIVFLHQTFALLVESVRVNVSQYKNQLKSGVSRFEV